MRSYQRYAQQLLRIGSGAVPVEQGRWLRDSRFFMGSPDLLSLHPGTPRSRPLPQGRPGSCDI